MIRILLGADDAYVKPMTIAAHSALRHLRSDRTVEVHLIDGGISATNRQRVVHCLEAVHPKARAIWRHADLSAFDNINVRRYSAASMIRLLIPHLFDQDVDRVLYIDSDVIVDGDIAELWDMDLGDVPVWAVQNGAEFEFDRLSETFEEISVPSGARYFNSGVLLMNLNVWRKKKISERVVDFMIRHNDRLSFPDQDALNAVVAGDWGRLPPRWNKQVIRLGRPEAAQFDEPGILHFTTHKPWRRIYPWKGKLRFQAAYLRSSWDPIPKALIIAAGQLLTQTAHHAWVKIEKRLPSLRKA